MKGFMDILQCSDGSYYTGSTNDLELRIAQHQSGIGSRHTNLRLPVELVYVEEFERVDEAFEREKQVQGWRREKKQALIRGEFERLVELAATASTGSATRGMQGIIQEKDKTIYLSRSLSLSKWSKPISRNPLHDR
jgi:putative endonuclease